jgi:hypothetical protein
MERTKHPEKFNTLSGGFKQLRPQQKDQKTKVSFTLALLLIVICCLAAAPVKADTVSWLTGTFGWISEIPFEGYFSTGNPNFPQGLQSANENGVYWANECTPDNPQYPDCHFQWSNRLGKTQIYIYDQNGNQVLSFSGYVTGEASEEVMACDDGDYACYVSGEMDYTFAGNWSNGRWHSVGSGDVSFSSSNLDVYFGDFTITTNVAPEPSTLALLGSGVVGLIGYGRKRLGR